MIILNNTPMWLRSKPTAEELGEFTDKLFNILGKLKAGKYHVKQILQTLQHVGDGAIVMENIFAHRHMYPGVSADQQKTTYCCLKNIPGITVTAGGMINLMAYESLMRGCRLEPQKGGLTEVRVLARNKITDHEMANALSHEGRISNPQEQKLDCRIDLWAYVRENLFSPRQLKELLERGCVAGSGWKPNREHFVLCVGLTPSEPVVAVVNWQTSKQATVWLNHLERIFCCRSNTIGSRLIMRRN